VSAHHKVETKLMEKTYNPEQIEAKYRSLWEDKNLFSFP
jgi:valyl-tRNA synthetase